MICKVFDSRKNRSIRILSTREKSDWKHFQIRKKKLYTTQSVIYILRGSFVIYVNGFKRRSKKQSYFLISSDSDDLSHA